ncbi:MAG: hypothetical protein J0L92_28710 [Deltaproteobacteria bacterium]|nr:hypothetical protein [Deltaproteobacteria bacterium]
MLATDRAPSAYNGAAPEHLDSLLEYDSGSLVEPMGFASPEVVAPDWVTVEPGDLVTAAAGSPPAIVFGPESDLYETCVHGGCARLVEYPEGTEVAFDLVAPERAYGDISRQVFMVPRRPLRDRWYAIEVDLAVRVWEPREKVDRNEPLSIR